MTEWGCKTILSQECSTQACGASLHETASAILSLSPMTSTPLPIAMPSGSAPLEVVRSRFEGLGAGATVAAEIPDPSQRVTFEQEDAIGRPRHAICSRRSYKRSSARSYQSRGGHASQSQTETGGPACGATVQASAATSKGRVRMLPVHPQIPKRTIPPDSPSAYAGRQFALRSERVRFV